MTLPCPNWLRVVFLALEITVFLPQLLRIWVQKTSTGLSLIYIFLNLLSATERFTVGFSAIVNYTIAGADAPAFFVHDPRTGGDWLNLLQLGVDWVLLLLFFILCLTYPPPHYPYASQLRILVAVLYTAFTLISVVPLFTDTLFPSIFHEPGERQLNIGVAIFMGFHLFFLNTIFTLVSICSIIPQAVQFRSLPSNSSVLRVRNCALQGVVLAMIAVSWVFRVKLPDGVDDLTPFRSIIWYVRVGWPAGGTGIFALVQGGLAVLGLVGRRRMGGKGVAVRGGETDPLLQATRDVVEEQA
ncbi:uncharacterized protein BO88DRAFT_250236 [Aspergillus vadensis CBS 113365]|uniref:Uncharacterized protein n=1 Tax=Aspergillus vadensis (strain CBS 113365 / IMI 142717 / IBT 24658) TaxID=1448311 RepID=A0A319BEE0_ASPVC|nr:hypothetical protein BO88DRAFT_250236 [Aspergillus vadensis CBS 113365]PYH70539.1 hypothetical protein BO88DRAFT_250236 [Aspergillus vadensis CBS 113365]